jgi:monofunctional biosynthetic peptidoglycan transglycosylase
VKNKKKTKPRTPYSILFKRIIIYSIITFFITTIFTTIVFSFINPQYTWLMISNRLSSEQNGGSRTFMHKWVDIDKISPNMILAAVAAEDNKFLYHHGFDWEAIKKAWEYNRKGKKIRGASTISQQTAKNVFLWPNRSWIRKGFEVYFTILIEFFWSKKRIMEVYLNVAEFGKGIYGVESASQIYYKKPASKLSRYEAAMLATVLPAPSKRNPSKPSKYMYRYQQKILWNMKNLGKIEFKSKSKPHAKKK